jgi:hypothetical protein
VSYMLLLFVYVLFNLMVAIINLYLKEVGVGLSNGSVFSTEQHLKSNSCRFLEIMHIVISDKRTSYKVFSMVMNKCSFGN